jgi:beta-mannosidase
MKLVWKGKTLASAAHYFVKPNQLPLSRPQITVSISQAEDSSIITLESDVVAKGVYLQSKNGIGNFSENYFDLFPGEKMTVVYDEDLARENLIVKSLLDY